MNEPARQDWQISVEAEAPAGWDDFLHTVPAAQFFSIRMWTSAVCRHLPGTKPLWLVARRRGELIGGMAAIRQSAHLLTRTVSHLDGTCGGPLLSPALGRAEQDGLCAELLHLFARQRGIRGTLVGFSLPAEMRERFGALARELGWTERRVVAAVLSLDGGLDHVERHVLKKNRRNERNRSLRRGCTAHITSDPAVLAEYYPIYKAATKQWGVKPTPLPMLQELLSDGDRQVFLTVVRYEGHVIGGHLNFHWADRVTAWNGATLPEHSDKFPATLLIWADLEEACRRQALWLDLGGSGGISSLQNFKRLLGAQEEIRGYYQQRAPLYQLAARLRRPGAG